MAGRINAKPANQTEPAKGAAVDTATGSATEQSVTPPVQTGGPKVGAAPAEDQGQGTPATVTLQVDGQTVQLDGLANIPAKAGDGTIHTLPENLTFEMECTVNPADMHDFFVAAFKAFASILAEAGVLVRRDGKELPPAWEDILAATIHQEGGAVVVTADGRKFKLNNGEVNEA